MRRSRAAFGISTKRSPKNNCAGVTLLELVVAITVFGIISAALIVNWSSFTKYQDMRRAAHSLHKELLGLKGKALEEGVQYRVRYVAGQNSYEITKRENNTTAWSNPPRIVPLPNNVVIINMPATLDTNGDPIAGEGPCSAASWAGEIIIRPDNLNSFGAGRMAITRSGSSERRMFCIARDAEEVNPRIFFSSDEGATWKSL